MGRSGTSADDVDALSPPGGGGGGSPKGLVHNLLFHSGQLEGCEWGCRDSICLLGYERTLFAVCSLAYGRSQPVPKTRNDCFHQ